MAKQFVNRNSAAGRKAYAAILDRIVKDKVCPFCEPHFKRYHTRPILRSGKSWLVTENMNPYEGTKKHILLVQRTHIEKLSQVSASAWRELLGHVQWIEKKYSLLGGAFFMRFGNLKYTGASVAHLHANILSGQSEGIGKDPIAVVLGFKKKKNSRA